MANTTGLQTVNLKDIQEVDAVPSAGGGTAADDPGSIAMLNNAGVGQMYLKTGAAATAWDRFVTANDGTFIAPGAFLRLALFDTSPGPAAHLADSALQNAQTIVVDIVTQPTRTAGITYNIPNPGDAITSADFVLTQGAQTISGTKTFNNDVVVQGNFTVNGSLTYIQSTVTNISDPFITLNKGGAAASAGGAGLQFEENALITASFLISAARSGYTFLAPTNANAFTLGLASLTANRTILVPDTAGTFVTRPTATAGVAGQVTYFADANNITSGANLFWDTTNSRLGIGNSAPSVALHVTGAARITSLTANQPVRSDTSGNLTNSLISLTGDVSGILPTTSGGTGTGTTFTTGSVVYANGSGNYAQDNANFFWDATNHRLGLGTTAPSRLLDVKGSSLFEGSMRFVDQTAVKANWERFQAYVATTDATVTTLASVTTLTDSVTYLKATITARRTGGSAGTAGDSSIFTRTVRVKNIAGTLTLSTLQTDFTSVESGNKWTATIDVNGTAARIRVTGAANNNIDWTANYEVTTLN